MTDEDILEIPDNMPRCSIRDMVDHVVKQAQNELKLKLLGETLTPFGEKKQKFEEIKKMAWELFKKMIPAVDHQRMSGKLTEEQLNQLPDTKLVLSEAWIRAEAFQELAEQKEKDVAGE